MIVKPNLIKDSYLKNPEFWKVGENFKCHRNIVTIMYNEPIDYGLILPCISGLKLNIDYILRIEVKGTREFKLDYNYFVDKKILNTKVLTSSEILSPNKWHKITLPFKYKYNQSPDPDFEYKAILVGADYRIDESDESNESFEPIEISFKNPKLTEGIAANIYTPSVNDLEPSKQAVFVAGGVFQEVYPI